MGFGATKGMKARKALRLARDLDVSGIAKAGAKGAPKAAADADSAAKKLKIQGHIENLKAMLMML